MQNKDFWMLVLSIKVSDELNGFSRYVGDLDEIRVIDTNPSLQLLGEFSKLLILSSLILGMTPLFPSGGNFLLGSIFSFRLDLRLLISENYI